MISIFFKVFQVHDSCGKFQVLNILHFRKKVGRWEKVYHRPTDTYKGQNIKMEIGLSNLSQRKDNQAMIFGQLLEHIMRNKKYNKKSHAE